LPAAGLVEAIRGVQARWLWASLGVALLAVSLRWLKWHLMQGCLGVKQSLLGTCRSLLGSYALGSLTPGRAGDLGRFLFVTPALCKPTLLLTLVDKCLDAWSVLAMGGIAALVAGPIWLKATGGALLVLLAWAILSAPRIHRCFRDSRYATGKFAAYFSDLHRFCPDRLGTLGSVALLAALAETGTLLLLLQAFNCPHQIVALVAYPCMILAGALPLSLGGLGPRESAATLLLPHFAVSAAVAVNISLLFFAFTLLLPGALGVVLVALLPPQRGLGWLRSLRLYGLSAAAHQPASQHISL
jgi:uncharacterized membrane protein YbhN (UPF0104 family)